MRSNCLIYAFRKFFKEGGYVLLRKSHYGWWPHFLHMNVGGLITHFSPEAPRKRFLPPLIFKGTPKEGDK